MNKYVIVSGGTGSMCVRALIFLVTAMKIGTGMGQDKLYIRVVDMDKQSDAAEECKKLIVNYNSLREQTNKGAGGGLKLPEIILDVWDFTDAVIKRAQMDGVNLTAEEVLSLKALFTRNKIVTAHDGLLMDTFFSQEEQKANLDKGFYGHPNIGAVVFNYVRNDFLDKSSSQFMKSLYSDLDACKAGEKVPVYLYGSLFGGTGASVSPNMIDVLRSVADPKTKANWGKSRMRIGMTMMMPYFKLPDADERQERYDLQPVSDKFFRQTSEALEYYKTFHIDDKVESFLLLGQKDLCITSEIYARGEKQCQHFHILLLAAAAAGLRFMEGNLPQGVLLWKLPWRQVDVPAWETIFANDIGLGAEERKLQEFFRFSVVVSQYMKRRYNDSVRGETVYDHLCKDMTVFKTCEDTCGKIPQHSVLSGWKVELSVDELDSYYRNPVNKVVGFCTDFIRFYYDCAVSGYDWSGYHVKRRNADGEIEVTEDKEENRMVNMNLRMVDLINVEEADRLVDEELTAEQVRNLMLNRYFDFDSVNRGRVKSNFTGTTTGKLFEDEAEKALKAFRGAGSGLSFSRVYVACYEAAKK